MSMPLSIIVAMTDDRVIGANGRVPWSIPGEMKLFKELTVGNTVIMGRSTWDSLPERFRPLPNRINIVVSTTMGHQEGITVCRTIEEAIEKTHNYSKEVFSIGGAQIYAATLPLADTLHISWIRKKYEGDTYFPKIDLDRWTITETKEADEFTYKKYLRKNQG